MKQSADNSPESTVLRRPVALGGWFIHDANGAIKQRLEE